MYCLKCGRESENEQVFCDQCLAVMKNYPVKRNAVVNLPKRESVEETLKKHPRRRVIPPEEQVIHLGAALRRLRNIAGVLLLLLAIVTGILVYQLIQPAPQPQPTPTGIMGRNYTTDVTYQP